MDFNPGPNCLPNLGIYFVDLPVEIFEEIKTECLEVEQRLRNNQKVDEMTSGLTCNGVAKHVFLNNTHRLFEFVFPVFLQYENHYNYVKNLRILTNNVPYDLGRPWINYQRKGEHMPVHNHDGLVSYTTWIKVPYDIKEELGENRSAGRRTESTASFEFSYSNILGNIETIRIPITKEHEGKMMLFPAKLNHCIYPFYSSDDYRISISGNVMLKG